MPFTTHKGPTFFSTTKPYVILDPNVATEIMLHSARLSDSPIVRERFAGAEHLLIFSDVFFNRKRTGDSLTLTRGVVDCVASPGGLRSKRERMASGRCAPGRGVFASPKCQSTFGASSNRGTHSVSTPWR